MSIIPNVTEYFYGIDGGVIDRTGEALFYAQSNYANLILVNLEDGVSGNASTFINFTPNKKTVYNNHWYYMEFQNLIQKDFGDGNGVRNFAQFALRVPYTVLQNNNVKHMVSNRVTFIQRYHPNYIGNFRNMNLLNLNYPPSEELSLDLSIAYVINSPFTGFYQVEYNNDESVYEWILQNDEIDGIVLTKTYSSAEIHVNAGQANPEEFASVNVTQYEMIMTMLSNLQQVIGEAFDGDFISKDFYEYPQLHYADGETTFVVNKNGVPKYIKKKDLTFNGTKASDVPPNPEQYKTWIDTNVDEQGFSIFMGDEIEPTDELYVLHDPTPEMPDSGDELYILLEPLPEEIPEETTLFELTPTGYDEDGNYMGGN